MILNTARLLFLLLCLANTSHSYSQQAPEKFGQITEEELSSSSCPIDADASAYFLFDFGHSYFEFNDRTGSFQLITDKHFRIKILDNRGFSWADIEIPLYYTSGAKEKVMKLKAVTYNLVNGKVEKSKLANKDIYTEVTNDYWMKEKFALPNVREGSIIEIQYSVVSDFFFNLKTWHFQNTIPILKSEYHAAIPEFYTYNITERGYFPLEKKSESRNRTVSQTSFTKRNGDRRIKSEAVNSELNFVEQYKSWYINNVPAFKVEEHLFTLNNYVSKIEFELEKAGIYDEAKFSTSWKNINEKFLEDYSYKNAYKKVNHLKSDVHNIKAKSTDLRERTILAFNHIKKNMNWNGYYSSLYNPPLTRAWNKKAGNSAEINLILVSLLNALDVSAYPVILSTQKNGIIHPSHPTITRMNYTICMAIIDGDTLLMDATDPQSNIGMLPVRCLNGKGRVIDDKEGYWINLSDISDFIYLESYKITVNDDLSISGENDMRLKNYAAYQRRKDIEEEGGQKNYIKAILADNPGLQLESKNMDGLDDISKDLNMLFSFQHKNQIENAGDILLLKPIYQPYIYENPFKLEERDYPVEYNYPIKTQQIYTISFPENHTIVEVPKPLIAKTPDNELVYKYSVNQTGNIVTISTSFSLSQTIFSSDKYEGLKEFYQIIIDKQNEEILFKK